MYDDPDNITPDEAKSVYRTYQLHRDEIDRVERSFGVTVDGEAAARNRLAQANRDFPALVNEYGSIPNIADALAPARTALLGELRQRHPDLADRLTDANFDAGRIYLDAGRDLRDQDEVDLQYPIDSGSTRTNNRNSALRREQHSTTTEDVDQDHAATIDSRGIARGRNPQGIESSDLLIGEGGDDTLLAHGGEDILIGGDGRDRMEGGHGHDTYVVGEGDAVMDSDGMGEVRWDARQLTGGSRSESDPANTYRSADGHFTYTINGDNLTVTNNRVTDPAQREGLVIENFRSGHLGITLTGPSRVGVQPQAHPPGLDEPDHQRGIEDDRQGMNQPQPRPSDDPFADRHIAALMAGDSDLADRIAVEFSQTPEGQQLAQLGDQLLAQQQALEQQQLEERERARQAPVLQM
ncbi:calcium-binding protein [Luteimonas sp. A649]